MTHKKLRVEDLMTTAVISLHARDTLERAREQMALAEIRHIPVIDDRQHVIGIISSHDVVRAGHKHKPQTVADIMTRGVVTVRPSTPAAKAAEILIAEKIGALPVIGDDEQLVGVITASDFLAVARQALDGLPMEDARAT
jgi:CBS domain-containing protein